MAHCNYNGPIGSGGPHPYPRDVAARRPDQQPSEHFVGPPRPIGYDVRGLPLPGLDPLKSSTCDILLATVRAAADTLRKSPIQALNYLADADKILAPLCKVPHEPAIYRGQVAGQLILNGHRMTGFSGIALHDDLVRAASVAAPVPTVTYRNTRYGRSGLLDPDQAILLSLDPTRPTVVDVADTSSA